MQNEEDFIGVACGAGGRCARQVAREESTTVQVRLYGMVLLISSPDFLSMHRARLHNNEDHPLLLTLYHSERKTVCTLRSSLTYKKVLGKDYEIPIAKHLEDLRNYYMYKICYADGLVFMFKTFTSEILLWNPSLGKTLELPPFGVTLTGQFLVLALMLQEMTTRWWRLVSILVSPFRYMS